MGEQSLPGDERAMFLSSKLGFFRADWHEITLSVFAARRALMSRSEELK